MNGFDPKFKDFPDYIIGITKEIWEDRGIGTLNHYYAPEVVVRSPIGIVTGNQSVIASTMATCHEFPDRQLFGADVIWSDDPEYGLLSSHQLITTATHSQDGQFGKATGKKWSVRVIADCAAKENAIYDEWLVRDYGGIVRQMGFDPAEFAASLIETEGGLDKAKPVFLPENDIDGGYNARGNSNEWGQKYADILTRIMHHDFDAINAEYDRAVMGEYAGGFSTLGRDASISFWLGLRSSFPHATFGIHHQIGMDADMLSPRAAIRWSLDGLHEGWGSFGKPSGKRVHVMGMSHAEFGPWGLRRECALVDEIAIWKQILMQLGSD